MRMSFPERRRAALGSLSASVDVSAIVTAIKGAKRGDRLMSNDVLSIRHGTVLEARLNRTEKKNARTGAMYDGIVEILEHASSNNSIRAVLLTAEGSTFTSGNDLAEFMSFSGDFAVSPQARFVRTIANAAKPIVAAVHGVAVRIGTTMLQNFVLVYGTPVVTLSTPFVTMGLVAVATSDI